MKSRWYAGIWLISAFLTLVAGCQGTAPEAAMPENNFLRAQPPSLGQVGPDDVHDLLPLVTGNWWEYTVQNQDSKIDFEHGDVATAPGKGNTQTGKQIRFTQAGKMVRSETYHVGADGIFLLEAKSGQTVVMSSPLPLIRTPMQENTIISWEGLLQFSQSSAPGRSNSRLTIQEPVTTPAGKFICWRVDTVLETNIGGRGVAQWDSRWFAPGVGMVKQESRTGSTQTLRLLTAYKIGSRLGGKRVQWLR